MSYLKVSGLNKFFGSFQALSNIQFEVEKGEFVCLLGPSGCGKTTLLRAIAGLEPQSSGQIEQAGVDISHLPIGKRDFGIVFQSYALFPNLTIFDNVAYGLKSKKKNKNEVKKRVEELLMLFGIDPLANRFPSQISGGQQQRAAMARALAIEPGLLLLDEPLSALDAKVRDHLRHELKEFQRTLGLTTIMVTHDQEEALVLADKVIVINEGKIEQIGNPLEIYSNPKSQFVAEFIGKMNFIPTDHLGPALSDKKVACFRPENLDVLAGPIESKVSLPVVVKTTEFLGPIIRYYLEAPNETELIMDKSCLENTKMAFVAGDKINVGVDSQEIHYF